MPHYECDCCGACCRGHLIVEADGLDLMREPRLQAADPHSRDHDQRAMLELLEEDDRCLVIACGVDHPCPFLGDDNRCSIYPTRPNGCVAMLAGDEQCQQARRAHGLPPLMPIDQRR